MSFKSIDVILIKIINKIVRLLRCFLSSSIVNWGFWGILFLKHTKKTPNSQNLKNLNRKINHLKKFTVKNLNQKCLKKRKYFTYQVVSLVI